MLVNLPQYLQEKFAFLKKMTVGLDFVVGGTAIDLISDQYGENYQTQSNKVSKIKPKTDIDFVSVQPDVEKLIANGYKKSKHQKARDLYTIHEENKPDIDLTRIENFYYGWMSDDALQRDFTICAVYIDASGNVYDPTGRGVQDILNKKLVMIGDRDPDEYFRNNPVCLLRAIKYIAQGYDADPRIVSALHRWKLNQSFDMNHMRAVVMKHISSLRSSKQQAVNDNNEQTVIDNKLNLYDKYIEKLAETGLLLKLFNIVPSYDTKKNADELEKAVILYPSDPSSPLNQRKNMTYRQKKILDIKPVVDLNATTKEVSNAVQAVDEKVGQDNQNDQPNTKTEEERKKLAEERTERKKQNKLLKQAILNQVNDSNSTPPQPTDQKSLEQDAVWKAERKAAKMKRNAELKLQKERQAQQEIINAKEITEKETEELEQTIAEAPRLAEQAAEEKQQEQQEQVVSEMEKKPVRNAEAQTDTVRDETLQETKSEAIESIEQIDEHEQCQDTSSKKKKKKKAKSKSKTKSDDWGLDVANENHDAKMVALKQQIDTSKFKKLNVQVIPCEGIYSHMILFGFLQRSKARVELENIGESISTIYFDALNFLFNLKNIMLRCGLTTLYNEMESVFKNIKENSYLANTILDFSGFGGEHFAYYILTNCKEDVFRFFFNNTTFQHHAVIINPNSYDFKEEYINKLFEFVQSSLNLKHSKAASAKQLLEYSSNESKLNQCIQYFLTLYCTKKILSKESRTDIYDLTEQEKVNYFLGYCLSVYQSELKNDNAGENKIEKDKIPAKKKKKNKKKLEKTDDMTDQTQTTNTSLSNYSPTMFASNQNVLNVSEDQQKPTLKNSS